MKGGLSMEEISDFNKETKDKQSRTYQLTINNPQDKDMQHENIKKILMAIPNLIYFCMSDEIGEQKTYHTHIYFKTKNPIKFSTIKNKFPTAHIEESMGTAIENRAYIRKEGKWENTEKEHTNLKNTFEEWGILPKEKRGSRSDLAQLYELIVDGLSNAEILRINPDYMKYMNHIERTRQAIREDEFKDKWRDIFCIYVFGETNTNKTRTYMERYGYSNVYRITNYAGNAVWDGYRGQDTIIFEEYRSQILISEMLTWIEGYPNCSLRARYSDKVACFTNVIFISNIPLEEQYPNVQKESPATWKAFLRRIQKVIQHKSKEEIVTYNSVAEYLHRNEQFHSIPEGTKTPFDNDSEQEKLPFED